MIDFKLANVLLELDDHLSCCPEILYRNQGSLTYSPDLDELSFEGSLDLLTYFNSLSCLKWEKYAGIDSAMLHLELCGDACRIEMQGVSTGTAKEFPMTPLKNLAPLERSAKAVSTGIERSFSGSESFESVEIEVELNDWAVVGPVLVSTGQTRVRNAYWYAKVREENIRPVRLALATTTFKKEAYVIPNIESIKASLSSCPDPISGNFHMFVVDNGRTLDAAALSDELVTIIPNKNVGGAGGFSRGMLAALEDKSAFTHVLLMDDDVRMSPESIKRTYNLLSLACDEYRTAFVNGAMLQLGNPDIQYEDVARVLDGGQYERCKGTLRVTNLADIALNEVVNVEVPNAYGAWWYSCIPLDVVGEKGLPLPVFVRCDDVEYGMRCNPTYMCMNGICVWHEAFDGRYRAAVDAYQYIRNFMVMMACDDKSNETVFFLRTERMLVVALRAMAYDMADLIVTAFEDYLKGPDFLASANGEDILKRNSLKNEKLLPLASALDAAASEHPGLSEKLACFKPDLKVLHDTRASSLFMKAFRALPYNRHLLPDALLRDEPATIFYGPGPASSRDQMGTSVLVACDRDGENAHVRFIDRDRYQELHNRWKKAKRHYRKNKDSIKRSYKRAMPTLTSVSFWKNYLGLD